MRKAWYLICGAALGLGGALGAAATHPALAQNSQQHIVITPRNPNVINLPVIPQGSYLDPGPGPAIKPDVGIGGGRNEDYVFPPNVDGFMGSSPPGDPTANGQWSPLPGDTPSF
ncbi:hypothetical protein [Aquabacter spiritensis]|uniref:Uncharacterized protein n=1 Tax=Aquabacter spiritensis TaxID=933073 RepID=A0A4V2UWU1_9HYPH|nr:hypothetical protein [Aquabacter spiritensis]TCT00958.1 hypothetical protein EDC64_12045 [Aquabacter spiritensis]